MMKDQLNQIFNETKIFLQCLQLETDRIELIYLTFILAYHSMHLIQIANKIYQKILNKYLFEMNIHLRTAADIQFSRLRHLKYLTTLLNLILPIGRSTLNFILYLKNVRLDHRSTENSDHMLLKRLRSQFKTLTSVDINHSWPKWFLKRYNFSDQRGLDLNMNSHKTWKFVKNKLKLSNLDFIENSRQLAGNLPNELKRLSYIHRLTKQNTMLQGMKTIKFKFISGKDESTLKKDIEIFTTILSKCSKETKFYFDFFSLSNEAFDLKIIKYTYSARFLKQEPLFTIIREQPILLSNLIDLSIKLHEPQRNDFEILCSLENIKSLALNLQLKNIPIDECICSLSFPSKLEYLNLAIFTPIVEKQISKDNSTPNLDIMDQPYSKYLMDQLRKLTKLIVLKLLTTSHASKAFPGIIGCSLLKELKSIRVLEVTKLMHFWHGGYNYIYLPFQIGLLQAAIVEGSQIRQVIAHGFSFQDSVYQQIVEPIRRTLSYLDLEGQLAKDCKIRALAPYLIECAALQLEFKYIEMVEFKETVKLLEDCAYMTYIGILADFQNFKEDEVTNEFMDFIENMKKKRRFAFRIETRLSNNNAQLIMNSLKRNSFKIQDLSHFGFLGGLIKIKRNDIEMFN